jgi:hypothetical protein
MIGNNENTLSRNHDAKRIIFYVPALMILLRFIYRSNEFDPTGKSAQCYKFVTFSGLWREATVRYWALLTINEESHIMKISTLLSAALLISTAMIIDGTVYARGSVPKPEVVVYVTSQGLYYDSIVLTDLPMKGNFQQLIPGMNGLETEFGPGQPGHLGGRWWVDLNDDGAMDADDMYFLCPLLGPGRTDP